MRSEQATRPLLYDLGSAVLGAEGGVFGGDGVGDGVGGRFNVGVGVVISVALDVDLGSFPPQADTARLSPMTVRNTVKEELHILV